MLWDVASGKNTARFQGSCPILSVAFHPGGKMLAYGSTTANFAVLDLPSGKRIPTLNEKTTSHTGGRLYVAFSPDGKTVASGSDGKTIKLWDVATGKARAVLEGHTGAVTSVAFSPDG